MCRRNPCVTLHSEPGLDGREDPQDEEVQLAAWQGAADEGHPRSPSHRHSTVCTRVKGCMEDITQRRCRSRSPRAPEARVVEEARSNRALQRHGQEAPPTSMICEFSSSALEWMDALGPGGHQLGDQSSRRVVPPASGFPCQDGQLAV